MRLAVTGAAGFIGSHLVDRLLADGHEVVGVDNLVTGSRENLAHLDDDSRFELVEADVCAPLEHPSLEGDLGGVYHLASPASPVHYLRLPLETLRTGSEGTRSALELARAKGARFLLASTSEVYGDPDVHPQREDYHGNVNPVGPRSVYDEAKRYAEALASAYAREGLCEVRIARIFNTYGPRMALDDGRALPEFIGAALRGEDIPVFGDGSQTRSFCYVSDLVDGLVRLCGSDLDGPVNLGNPVEITILELAREIIDLAGSSSGIAFRPLPEDDPRRRRPDIARAREGLGWEPRVERRDGLGRTIEDFRRRLDATG
ncbi:MAG: UDP-glucuronic acid decarboxylase family protein [Planctomycetota bacterium]|jgi:dTDP-glucose 4,6-dehydratase